MPRPRYRTSYIGESALEQRTSTSQMTAMTRMDLLYT